MNTRFTYCGNDVVEVIIDGDSVTWNVLPIAAAAPVAPPPLALPPESPPVPAAAPEPDPAAEEEALQLAADSRRPKRPPDAPVEPQEPVLAAPMPEAVPAIVEAPAPTKKKRTLWGAIRATWFVVFTIVGESLTYALNNLTSFNLPPGTATAIGAVGYGVKRGIWPDTTL